LRVVVNVFGGINFMHYSTIHAICQLNFSYLECNKSDVFPSRLLNSNHDKKTFLKGFYGIGVESRRSSMRVQIFHLFS
jgi:hypothetical protein